MKVKDLLNLLRTEYIELSNIKEKYGISYIKKNNIPSDILEMQINDIIPIPGLRKQLFDENAPEGDYVAAIKVIYTDEIPETEPVKEETYYYQEEEPQSQQPNFGSIPPFGFDLFKNQSLIDNLLTPEMLDYLKNNDLMKNLMTPERVNEILNSDEFKEMMKNVDISDILSGGFGPFGSFSNNPFSNNDEDSDDDDDEYEEI